MKHLTDDEIKTINQGYALPGAYCFTEEKKVEVLEVWNAREARINRMWGFK